MCTGLNISSEDKKYVTGRTMEWGLYEINSKVLAIPRNYLYQGSTPEGMNGKKWKTKYGMVGINFDNQHFLLDGMNEKGLVIGAYFFSGFANFLSYKPNNNVNTISAIDFVNYFLSCCATVEECKKEINNVDIVMTKMQMSDYDPIDTTIHWMISDQKGHSIVVEYTDGNLNIFDNYANVVTNDPTFDWHLTNLRNYSNLFDKNLSQRKKQELILSPLGSGSELIGLPGDFTSVSRFIRVFLLSQMSPIQKKSQEAIFALFRILDNFNVPVNTNHMQEKLQSSTLWTSAWDTNDLSLYYHTQYNRQIRSLKFSSINFDSLEELKEFEMDQNKTQTIDYL